VGTLNKIILAVPPAAELDKLIKASIHLECPVRKLMCGISFVPANYEPVTWVIRCEVYFGETAWIFGLGVIVADSPAGRGHGPIVLPKGNIRLCA
jgi:hypothetical protein